MVIEECIEFTDRFLRSWPEASWSDVGIAIRLRFEHITEVRVTQGKSLVRIFIRTANTDLGMEFFAFEVEPVENLLRSFK